DQAPTDTAVVVPTPAMLTGDFSQFVKVYSNSAALTGGCQSSAINNSGAGSTPGLLRLTDGPNFINPARFNKSALALVHLLPQVTAVPNNLETARSGFQDTANLGTNGQDNKGAFFTIGDTYVFSPTVVNTLSLGVNRTYIHRVGPVSYDVKDLGINAFTYL